MSAKQPEIKFSPFEALLIGEKNRALKCQPTKNTIFVTRLNQKSKFINLRDLFGVEKSTTGSSNDDIFKMPQRVYEFFNKKHSYENDNVTENNADTLCNEYKGQKMFLKNNNSVKPKHKKSKTKLKKVKFKEKYNKVQGALKNHSKIKKYNAAKRNNKMAKLGLKKGQGNVCSPNRYGLRSKVMCETEYESLQSHEVSNENKQDFLSNYVSKFLMDNSKNIFDNMSEWDEEFDLSTPNTLLKDLLEHNYYYHGGFEFPKCPETGISDFDNDEHLVDIIYESFPNSFKFESKDSSTDFIDALINADIIKPVKDLETNTTNEVLEEGEKVKVSCGTQTSRLDLPIDLSSCCHLQSLRNGYITTADGFVTIQNHLITDENFGGLFLNNPNSHDRNDLIMLSLVKPILHSSWVRSL